MAAPPLVSLSGAVATFGGRPLFENIDLALTQGDRACLVGRNGSGKSTLMKALAGVIELDGGSRFVQPGARVAYLLQEPIFTAATLAEHVLTGTSDPDAASAESEARRILLALDLDPDRAPKNLSGGEARRADLARVLVGKPEVLLLDEPTNHLDLPTIAWLEGELGRYRGAMLLISHDRAFMARLTTRIFWLDRGEMRRLGQGYAQFEQWAADTAAAEALEASRLDKKLQVETQWMREGISARRKRNQGRVRALQDLRQTIAEKVRAPGGAKLEVTLADAGGSLVAEAEHVTKRLGERVIVNDFSCRVQRGARIGVIGRNGAGKSTLLKLLTGSLQPDTGRVRIGFGIELALFDQSRSALDPDQTLWRTILPNGGDQVVINGRPRHIITYLRDFLFSEQQATGTVKALSGGERARLLLAALFAQPSNLLVLDEPTNDLDMETLDLLQEVLADYDGTVLLVSHDRDFLDRVATSTLVLSGDGKIIEYAGGYTDAIRQGAVLVAEPEAREKSSRTGLKPTESGSKPTSNRLSFKDQRERSLLPKRIADAEAAIAKAEALLADATLFARDPARFNTTIASLEAARADLAAAEDRWLELEMLAEEAGAR